MNKSEELIQELSRASIALGELRFTYKMMPSNMEYQDYFAELRSKIADLERKIEFLKSELRKLLPKEI